MINQMYDRLTQSERDFIAGFFQRKPGNILAPRFIVLVWPRRMDDEPTVVRLSLPASQGQQLLTVVLIRFVYGSRISLRTSHSLLDA